MLEVNNEQIRSSSSENPKNPFPLPGRFLRLLSMGCGISKLDPKEVVEAATTANSSNKTSTFNCFTGFESKSNLVQKQTVPNNHNHDCGSRDEEKTKINVKREGGKEGKFELDDRRRSSSNNNDIDDDDNEKNGREICRGGSPSFREYCVDSDPESTSFKSEVYCDGDRCTWPNERTLNPEKEKGLESEMMKKERAGKGIMKALQRGKSGGMRNFISPSRGQQNDSSQKLLPKPS